MPIKLVAQEEIRVGERVVLEGESPSQPYAAVFEDDGDTGYFYALDTSREGNPILDALHIYNAEGVRDRHLSSMVQIVWSADDLKAALIINGSPHAVFDFVAHRGYCRTAFPPPLTDWTAHDHAWDDAAVELFRA
jgi:hypothetical protein